MPVIETGHSKGGNRSVCFGGNRPQIGLVSSPDQPQIGPESTEYRRVVGRNRHIASPFLRMDAVPTPAPPTLPMQVEHGLSTEIKSAPEERTVSQGEAPHIDGDRSARESGARLPNR